MLVPDSHFWVSSSTFSTCSCPRSACPPADPAQSLELSTSDSSCKGQGPPGLPSRECRSRGPVEARESRESSCCRRRWRGRARNWPKARACASARVPRLQPRSRSRPAPSRIARCRAARWPFLSRTTAAGESRALGPREGLCREVGRRWRVGHPISSFVPATLHLWMQEAGRAGEVESRGDLPC